MRLRDRLRGHEAISRVLGETYGVTTNPFPSASQSRTDVHLPIPADEILANEILNFFKDRKSRVAAIVGSQGVGKTNFLNHIEAEVRDAILELPDRYVVRYIADPEPSFDGMLRIIFQELGVSHLTTVAKKIATDPRSLDLARIYDFRAALTALSKDVENERLCSACFDWFLGGQVLPYHRSNLHINFRLDTIESRISILRDYVTISNNLGTIGGIFLLFDELEKHPNVLAGSAVVRYLSALRVIIDAFPENLFTVIAVTHDAMLRYSSALPALRSRFEDHIELSPLESVDEGRKLAEFYIEASRSPDSVARPGASTPNELLTQPEIERVFANLLDRYTDRAGKGVPQREFLHGLHVIVEGKIRELRDASRVAIR